MTDALLTDTFVATTIHWVVVKNHVDVVWNCRQELSEYQNLWLSAIPFIKASHLQNPSPINSRDSLNDVIHPQLMSCLDIVNCNVVDQAQQKSA